MHIFLAGPYPQKTADRMVRVPDTRKNTHDYADPDDGYECPLPPVLEGWKPSWKGFNTQEIQTNQSFLNHRCCVVVKG
jgi:hypothetical protein